MAQDRILNKQDHSDLTDSAGKTAIAESPKIGKSLVWQRWTPYAAVVWSLFNAALGIYWALTGKGFPFTPESAADPLAPIIGRFGITAAWIVVILAGFPAVAAGLAMLRGVRGRAIRPILITAGVLLAGVLLLLMTGLNLLVLFGYIPYAITLLFKGSIVAQRYLTSVTQWATIYQVICLLGGFLWLAATFSYTRLSGDACLHCGRSDNEHGWTSPDKAARWCRTAVFVSMVAPVFYAITRYAWALGIPMGMNEAYLREGMKTGMWTSGLFLATFGLVGALITLGLIQRWGEVFPRWMIGLAGRRVPIWLAIIPSALISVLLVVGGIGIWASLGGMAKNLENTGSHGTGLVIEVFFQLGPTLLFPLWGIALAIAAMGYYFRRRGPCKVCGRG